MNLTNNQNELSLFYKKYSKDFADLAFYYKINDFDSLSIKDKILVLAHRLKKEKRFNFASFLFDKLFTTFTSMNALINKIECLISMGKFEKALHFNNIAFELFLEIDDSDSIENIEKTLAYQKAKIYFLSSNLRLTANICEDYILKAKQKRFFTLLCATLIALEDFCSAEKLLTRFLSQVHNFLAETLFCLHSINQTHKFTTFVKSTKKLKINNEHFLAKNLETLTAKSDIFQAIDELLKQEIIVNNTNKSTLTTEVIQCKE